MLDKQQMRQVIEEHVDAENAGDGSRVLETYSRRAPIFEDVALGVRCVGGEEIIGQYRGLWDGFPNAVRRVTRWTFGEDSAVIEVAWSGKHDFRGLPASGRDISMRGIGHFEFDSESRIQRETVYYDQLTFMRQMGVSGG